ncbi:hypothetical protein SNOG_06919 [Parastagonospora nodorum SN15]|uniref:Peptidase S54 rhomboid domain-containing protein n=1 Tax=Phaeosphaeria nodorum (strain SN15 / ATCC MYA-4574 / FGSC 10173) TaxID=321614 RepID=Q0UMU5_PHANO|nr:hypothetical protein SNOG_06919 [Parastagonospora nodorum SN15]EAT85570.2 hypothetical protein SNOG_06919 [Parastagonospora nodorum SN15]
MSLLRPSCATLARRLWSLADYGVDNLGKQYTHVSRETALKGLEWLREVYPIDEARAAEEWAEKEANRIQYELWLADPETESKYKDPARAFKEQMQKEEEERQQQERDERKIGILHAGKSQFERNIEEKRKQRLEEITRVAEEKEEKEREMEEKLATGEWVKTPTGKQLMKPGQSTYVDVFGREMKSLSGFASEEEMLSKTTLGNYVLPIHPDFDTNTTQAQRLYPMTAFVLFTVILSYGFAHYYLPPSPSYRLFPDVSPSIATLGALLVINGAVAIAWRIMPLWPLMIRYFMHVPGYPRAVQSVLNVFSHVQYEHLLANMMTLCILAPACHDLVGRGTFLGTYISAGAVGTLASLYWANLGRGVISAHSVGASAAIWGIASLFLLLTDKEKIKVPFLKDVEFSFWPKMLTLMDHASHFGGMAVGIAVAGYLRATGFHEKRLGAEAGVQERAGVDDKTVDAGAMAKEGLKEVKDSLTKSSK